MFCAGLFSLLAQILALRELLVIFFGNELTFGTNLGFWLVGAGLGSLIMRGLLGRMTTAQTRRFMIAALLLLALALPFQLVGIRHLRFALDAPFGGIISFENMLAGAGVALLPFCVVIGALFPCACRLTTNEFRHAVNRIYALDAIGSMAGGVLFTFLLVHLLPPLSTAALAGAFAVAGAALLTATPRRRLLLWLLAACMAGSGMIPSCLAAAERAAVRAQWRSFGFRLLDAPGGPRLLYSCDSRYQNLALLESEGQKTLYGNGQVLFSFPEPIAAEHEIHFIMAQKPDAQSALLIGGAPASDLPELLKYPLSRLLHVELDGKIHRILDNYAGPTYQNATADARFEEYHLDGPRFVKTCRESFDIIIIAAPAPATMALNRFYTSGFFRDTARILNANGFLCVSLNTSVHLGEEAAGLAASIYRSLESAFDRVMVTAGERTRFFAGHENSPITLDRETLFMRSAEADIPTDYFLPEYFLAADEISAEKLAFVKTRLENSAVPANTSMKPVSTYYSMMLWSRFSGSGMEWLFNGLRRARWEAISLALLSMGAIFLAIGVLSILRGRKQADGTGRFSQGWFRGMLFVSVGSTGFCEMALQVTIIFIFQNLCGYVYERIGLITALYMCGLALGAGSAVWMTGPRRAMPGIIGLDIAVMIAALAAAACIMYLPHVGTAAGVEAAVYALMVFTGWVGGAQFPLANHILRAHRSATGATAALTNAVDLSGSAAGGFIIGMLLLPIMGILPIIAILTALKACSLLGLLPTFMASQRDR